MRGLQGWQTDSNFWNSKHYSLQRNIKKKKKRISEILLLILEMQTRKKHSAEISCYTY
jgi:hypothetical protein